MTETVKIQKIIINYIPILYYNKLENPEEMDRFLNIYELPKLSQENIKSLNNPLVSNEIEAVIKNLNKKSPGPDQFTTEYYKNFMEYVMLLVLKLFNEIEREGIVLN